MSPVFKSVAARLPRPDHPGYYEGMVVSSSRVMASGAIFAALVLALGGGHLAIAALGALPFLARLSHLVVPALVRRHGSVRVAALATWVERGGLALAGVAGIVRPDGFALPLLLAGFAVCVLGQSLYDVSLASLHTEACAPGAYGRYSATKTRWASVAGLAVGILLSIALDSLERHGLAPHVARGVAIVGGAMAHLVVTFALRRMAALARSYAREQSAQPATSEIAAPPGDERSRDAAAMVRRSTGVPRDLSWLVLPRTPAQWAVVHFGLAWGGALGISMRQSEAMALTVLGVSVGGIMLLNSLLIGAGILGAGTWGRLVDRFGGKGLMSIALLVLALDPVWLLAALFVHPAFLVPSYALWGMFNSAWNIAAGVTLVRTTGPAADRIRTLALFNVAYGLGAGTAPIMGGLLLELLDARYSPVTAYGTLFTIATTLRLATYPLLRAMPAPPAERGSYVSRVMLRAWSARFTRWSWRARLAPGRRDAAAET